jgi:hypothetical protein
MLVIIRLNYWNRMTFYYFGVLPIKTPFIALEIEIGHYRNIGSIVSLALLVYRTPMTDHNHTAGESHIDPLAEENSELENFGEENKNNDVVAKVATIAVIGVGAALIATELIPGMLIGLAAAFLPGLGPKLRPMFKSTVRAGYAAVQKTREVVAEASESMEDVVAEAKADHESKAEKSTPPPAESHATN